MASIRVALGPRSYDIEVGAGLIEDPARYQPFLAGRKAALVTSAVVAPIYLARVARALRTAVELDAKTGGQAPSTKGVL